MKKTKTLLAILALVLTLGVTLGVVLSVTAASSVVESDWISAPSKTLVKCPGGDCDHSACDYVYSFAVVGDTQYMTKYDGAYQRGHLKYVYDWLIANAEKKIIQYVFGLGDITDTYNKTSGDFLTANEWAVAYEQISRLNGVIPYSIVRGNHDNEKYMNQYFANDAY
jgi:hypothetical protein